MLELVNETPSRFLRPGARIVEQRFGKHCLVEKFLLDLILGTLDHAQRGEHVGDDFVVGESASLGETARNARVQKS